jgi:hypothetical protein
VISLSFPTLTVSAPGQRGFRRAIQSILRQLTAAALVPTHQMTAQAKQALFHLVPEYSEAVLSAASLAAKVTVQVTMPDDSFLVPASLLSDLYIDYLVYGVATFELAGDVPVYADPQQFRWRVLETGEIEITTASGAVVSDRVGVLTLSKSSALIGRSVPETIPMTFLLLLSHYSRWLYILSPYCKPDVLILTSETMSPEEVLARRRRLIEQADEDYANILLYAHGEQDRVQVVDLARSMDAPKTMSVDINQQIDLLRSVCGAIPPFAPIHRFFQALTEEWLRLVPEATVTVTGLPTTEGGSE